MFLTLYSFKVSSCELDFEHSDDFPLFSVHEAFMQLELFHIFEVKYYIITLQMAYTNKLSFHCEFECTPKVTELSKAVSPFLPIKEFISRVFMCSVR